MQEFLKKCFAQGHNDAIDDTTDKWNASGRNAPLSKSNEVRRPFVNFNTQTPHFLQKFCTFAANFYELCPAES